MSWWDMHNMVSVFNFSFFTAVFLFLLIIGTPLFLERICMLFFEFFDLIIAPPFRRIAEVYRSFKHTLFLTKTIPSAFYKIHQKAVVRYKAFDFKWDVEPNVSKLCPGYILTIGYFDPRLDKHCYEYAQFRSLATFNSDLLFKIIVDLDSIEKEKK